MSTEWCKINDAIESKQVLEVVTSSRGLYLFVREDEQKDVGIKFGLTKSSCQELIVTLEAAADRNF